MAKEIKFRGQRIDTKEWVYGCHIYINGLHFIFPFGSSIHHNAFCSKSGNFTTLGSGDNRDIIGFEDYGFGNYDNNKWLCEVIPETVGQYTGLKDINNVDIYPGNIYENIYDKNILKWLVEDEFYRLVIVNICTNGYLGEKFPVISKYYFEDRILVGNIHNNPELLNK